MIFSLFTPFFQRGTKSSLSAPERNSKPSLCKHKHPYKSFLQGKHKMTTYGPLVRFLSSAIWTRRTYTGREACRWNGAGRTWAGYLAAWGGLHNTSLASSLRVKEVEIKPVETAKRFVMRRVLQIQDNQGSCRTSGRRTAAVWIRFLPTRAITFLIASAAGRPASQKTALQLLLVC
jgi:hypothetical protein